jgi:hypothetical protein
MACCYWVLTEMKHGDFTKKRHLYKMSNVKKLQILTNVRLYILLFML